MASSWCDKLASTPAIGVFLDKRFSSSADALDKMVPILNKIAGIEDDNFNVSKQDSFSLEIAVNSGFHFLIAPGHISVDFRHRLKLKQTSGSTPTVELLSRAAPYSNLSAEALRLLVETVDLLNPARNRTILKIGLVTTTQVEFEAAPPGIKRLIEYVSAPWKGEMPYYDFQLVGKIDEHEKWSDACIHHITYPEAADSLLTIKLDYQRTFKEDRKSSSLAESFKPFIEAAMAYFEEVAEGANFHVNG